MIKAPQSQLMNAKTPYHLLKSVKKHDMLYYYQCILQNWKIVYMLNISASAKCLCNFLSIHVMGYASRVFHLKALFYTKQSQLNQEYLTKLKRREGMGTLCDIYMRAWPGPWKGRVSADWISLLSNFFDQKSKPKNMAGSESFALPLFLHVFKCCHAYGYKFSLNASNYNCQLKYTNF